MGFNMNRYAKLNDNISIDKAIEKYNTMTDVIKEMENNEDSRVYIKRLSFIGKFHYYTSGFLKPFTPIFAILYVLVLILVGHFIFGEAGILLVFSVIPFYYIMLILAMFGFALTEKSIPIREKYLDSKKVSWGDVICYLICRN